MHQLKNSFWWFVGQGLLAEDLLRSFFHPRGRAKILDAGCGPGVMLSLLKRRGWAAGLDQSPLALKYCREDGQSPLCQGSLCQLPFKDCVFDLIVVFDVLYHQDIADDGAAIKEIYRCLKPQGVIVLREPALEGLRRKHDIVEFTRRRYRLGVFRIKIENAGFKIRRVFYANVFILPLLLTVKFKERFLEPPDKIDSDLVSLPTWLNRLLIFFCRIEVLLLRKINFPLGASVVCVAVKDSGG
ncbi:MAG: class I SAM-dependent methyltransferase [Candidatus Omnitrophota bacterium]